MNLKTINIGGEKRPLHFGLYALKQITEHLGIEVNDFMAGISITTLSDQVGIARIGLNEGARRAGIGVELSEVDVYDLLDDSPEALDQIIAVYFEQTFGQKIETFIKEYDNAANKEKNGKVRAQLQAAVAPLKKTWPEIKAKADALTTTDYKK